ncbi:MAG: magnesium transporter [Candidatus Diapherotrites archaeon]|nr:magnesium transporter [Candidatus Diapherotrites archaeon]
MRRVHSTIPAFVRETLPVLFFAATIEILAGMWLQANITLIASFLGAFILLPALNNIRGSIAASTASQLASHTHLGLIDLRRKNIDSNPDVKTIFESRRILTLVLCIATGVGAFLLIPQATFPHLLQLVGISVVTGLVTGEILHVLLIQLLLLSHRRGWDPDNTLIPPIMALGDLFTIIFIIFFLQILGGLA